MYNVYLYIYIYIGWSDNRFDCLHFRCSLEASKITTCAAEQTLMMCELMRFMWVCGRNDSTICT